MRSEADAEDPCSVVMKGHGISASDFYSQSRHASMTCGRLKVADN